MGNDQKDFINDISLPDLRLYNLIPRDSKVLFVKPFRYRSLSYLIQKKNIELSVLSREINKVSYLRQLNAKFIRGDVSDTLPSMVNNQFDVLILDDLLLSYVEIVPVLLNCVRVAKYCIVSIRNGSRLKERIKFLFQGRFTHNKGEAWYNSHFLRRCSINDFMLLCNDLGIIIERGCYYGIDGKISNIYDLSKIPSLFSDKIFFNVSKN